MSTTTTIKAGELGKTITLPEGKSLTIKPTVGSFGTSGMAYLLDQALGGTNSKQAWQIGAAPLAPIGAYEGTQKILITCTAGSIDATVGNAVLQSPSSKTALDAAPGLTLGASLVKLAFANSVIFVGDSITRNHWATTAGAILTRVGGVTTVTNATTGMASNMNCLIEQFADTSFNRFVGPITRISATSFSYADPGPDATTTGGFIANPYRLADNGYVTWLRAQLGNRIVMPYMGARGGDRTDQIYARMDADVMAYQPSSICVMAGINDFVQNLTADASGNLVAATAAAVFANIKKIYDKARAAGIQIYACSTLPLEYKYGYSDAAYAALTTPQKAAADAAVDAINVKVMALNGLIRAEVAAKAGMIYCPTFEAIADPNSSKAQPLTGMMSGDHIHPAARGGKAAADAIAPLMASRIPPRNTLISSAYDTRNAAGATSTNVFTSLPNTSTGGNAVTGTNATGSVPVGFNGASVGSPTSCVFSGVARTVASDGDAIGYNVQCDLTAAGAGDGFTISSSAAAGSWVGNLVAGNAYYLECAVDISGVAGSNLRELFAEFTLTIGGVAYAIRVMDKTSTTFPVTDMKNYVFQSIPFFLSAAPTNVSFSLSAATSAAGTKLTAKLARCGVQELSAGSTLTY